MKNLIFVDVEATGPCIGKGEMTEFGAVHFLTRDTFHGILFDSKPSIDNPALSVIIPNSGRDPIPVFRRFRIWLEDHTGRNNKPVFVSDNPAFDWQWINHGFWHSLDFNPFGHSGRRISDFFAGVYLDWYNTQDWKKWRQTPHDHNPVNDAMGNVEAFYRILDEVAKKKAHIGL